MGDLADFATAAAAVQNPQTSAADLGIIAQYHPGLRAAVAGHPNAYPALIGWLRQQPQPVVYRPQPQPVAYQAPYQAYPMGNSINQPAPRRRNNAGLIAIIILVVLAIIAALVVFVFKPGGAGMFGPASPKAPWSANWGSGNMASFSGSAITPDGGVVVVGCTGSQDDCQSLTDETESGLVKYNPNGTLAWSHTYGDGNSVMELGTVAVARDGTIVVAGYTDSTSGAIRSSGGGLDAILATFTADGTPEWAKAYGGSGDDWFNAVAVGSGGIFAVGVTASPDGGFHASADNLDGIAASVTMKGDLNWIKSYGGEGNDYFVGMAMAADGTMAVGGLTRSTTGDFPMTNDTQDAVLASLRTDGTLAWDKTFGGSSTQTFYAVAAEPDGTIIAAGFSDSPDGTFPAANGNEDGVVVSVTADGTLNWATVVGGDGNDDIESLAITGDGTIIAAGSTSSTDGSFVGNHGGSDAFVVSLSESGSQNWLKCFGGSDDDWFKSVVVAANGNIVAAGSTSSSDGDFPVASGNQDAVVASMTPTGSLI